MNEILIPISPGELLDKITILQIKSERIKDVEKNSNVRTELNLLMEVWDHSVDQDENIDELSKALRSVNESLWEIEDDIRDEERKNFFGERFVMLARSVYVVNDERADIKKKINLHLNSTIVEEKSYQNYTSS